MKEIFRPHSLTITHPDGIDILLTFKKCRWLEPFMTTPQNLKTASEIMNTTMGRYSYWLKRYLLHGLLSIAYEEQRRGSTIKYYWCTAEQYECVISKSVFQHTIIAMSIDHTYDVFSSLEKNVPLHFSALHATIQFTNQGSPMLSFKQPGASENVWQSLLKPDAPALFSASRRLPLDIHDAKALQKDLFDLLEKYKDKTNPEKPYYRIVTGLAPVNEEN